MPKYYKRLLQSRIERESDATVQRQLRIVSEHYDCEIAGDLQGVMKTLVPEPTDRLYYMKSAAGQCLRTEIRGGEAVRKLYHTAIAEGTLMLQELIPRWLLADANGVAFDASARLAFHGNWLSERGYQCDSALNFLYQGRLCAFIMVNNESLLAGEEVYFDPIGFEGILDCPIASHLT